MPFLFDLLYAAALVLLSPWLLLRAARTGRYRRDLRAKLFGAAPLPHSSRPTAWFHGVSVGEVHLLAGLVAAFRRARPGWRVVVSATTDTGLAEARAKFPDLAVIPYPFDFSGAVRASLDAVRPNLIVLAESDLWPNFLAAAKARRVPVVVVNGRISRRSFARMRRVKSLVGRFLLRPVARFAVQSEEYAGHYRALGPVRRGWS